MSEESEFSMVEALKQDPDEIRRPGIVNLFNRLREKHPKKPIWQLAFLAKRQWYSEVYLPNKAAIDAGTYRPEDGKRVAG